MTDAVSETPVSQKSTAFFTLIKGMPHLELAAPVQIFPCVLPNSQQILVHLNRPPDNVAIKNLYQDGGMKMKMLGGNKVELIGEDLSYCQPFFRRFFKAMTLSSGEPLKKPQGTQAQLDWLANHRALRLEEEVVKNGFLSVNSSSQEVDADIGSLDELADDVGGSVRMYTRVYDPIGERVTQVYLTHHHRELKELDNVRWQKAVGTSEMDTEESEFRRKENYNIIADLYQALFHAVDGVVLDGEFCNDGNKGDWIPKIQFNWMYMAVTQAFRGTQLKNE